MAYASTREWHSTVVPTRGGGLQAPAQTKPNQAKTSGAQGVCGARGGVAVRRVVARRLHPGISHLLRSG